MKNATRLSLLALTLFAANQLNYAITVVPIPTVPVISAGPQTCLPPLVSCADFLPEESR